MIYYVSNVIFTILILTGIITYSNYGKGIGYTVVVALPAICIGLGLLAKCFSRWWIVLLGVCIISIFYTFSISVMDAVGLFPYLFVSVILGLIVGINSRCIANYA